ncbi:hypothetical protein [Cellulomonas sp. Root137]|uniref:hypothetical protein n=1 Tax=Cellulomonas sp. Root137 TaxID=1736459 RepID=UPI0006FA733B|nr:hypothetical protein [Cellulomonas sp. Root137]KQY43717.1 hypothetical protein ASD18_15215 [Cellulomonas sp. Root137]
MTTTQQVRTATHTGATAEQLRARRQEHVARARAAHLMLAARRARHGADAAAVAAAAAPDDERLLRQAQALEATADHVETAATAARREWALASLAADDRLRLFVDVDLACDVPTQRTDPHGAGQQARQG